MSVVRRFALAGLEVELRGDRADTFDHMAGDYHRYPSAGGPIDLVVEIERRAGFAESRERGPEYPAFALAGDDAGQRFERFDVAGTVDREARVARFVVGDSPNSLEAAIRVAVASALPRVDALILHASAVEAGGRARVFCGPSGAGKSTIAALLDGADIAARRIADELLVVSLADQPEVVIAPFISEVAQPHGERFALASVELLVQAPEHERRPLRVADALAGLSRNIMSFAAYPEALQRVLDLAVALASTVDIGELRFAPRADVASVLGLT